MRLIAALLMLLVSVPSYGAMLTGMTPSNYTIPSGWTLLRTQDFESTRPTGESWGTGAKSTTRVHGGTYSWAGVYNSDQDAHYWIYNSGQTGTFSEMYLSFYEWIDATALFNDEFYLAQFYLPGGLPEVILDWFWPSGFNKPSANLYVNIQGTAAVPRIFLKKDTVHSGGAWRQWEIHYRPSTYTGTTASSVKYDGFIRIYLNGSLWASAENARVNGPWNMSNMAVKVGGTYTKLVWMTDYPTCSLPDGCSTAPGSGTDRCTVSMGWSGQLFSAPKCAPIDPPLAAFNRYFDDIILLKIQGSTTTDTSPPYVSSRSPASGSTGVPSTSTTVTAVVKDDRTNDTGIVSSSIAMTIEGAACTETITGTAASYTVSCTSATPWSDGQTVDIGLTARDVQGNQMTAAWTFTAVTSATLPAITQTALPSGRVAVPYTHTMAATGGQTPYSWLAAGTLPPGLTMSPTGVISGTPSTAGTYLPNPTVTDANGNQDDWEAASITIEPEGPGGSTVQYSIIVEDTWVLSGAPTTTAAEDDEIRIYSWPAGTVSNRGYLMDNVSVTNLPDNVVITSAKLMLYRFSSLSGGGSNPWNVTVYKTTPFVAETLTWNNQPTSLTALSTTAVGQDNSWYEWDITNYAQEVYASGDPLYLAIDGGTDGVADSNRRFASYEYTDDNLIPRVVVIYHFVTGPDPGAPRIGAPGRMRVSKFRGLFGKR